MTDFPPVDGVEHRFVEVRGMRMHVAEAGAGEPLLLVHGWPQHWYQWRGVIERLADVRRLIVPDLRGFGWSDAPAGPIEPDVFVDDLIALLDALDIEQTDLAGHDWGGYTSLLLAARHPERLERWSRSRLRTRGSRSRPASRWRRGGPGTRCCSRRA